MHNFYFKFINLEQYVLFYFYRFKDGVPLKGDDHVKLISLPDGTVRLVIENVKPTDCGAYKLIAKNKNGENAAICAVAVKRKLEINHNNN